MAPAGGRAPGPKVSCHSNRLPVGAAHTGNHRSFRRNRRFQHFNKLTLRDFADASLCNAPEPKC